MLQLDLIYRSQLRRAEDSRDGKEQVNNLQMSGRELTTMLHCVMATVILLVEPKKTVK